jgi:hypothetical protein
MSNTTPSRSYSDRIRKLEIKCDFERKVSGELAMRNEVLRGTIDTMRRIQMESCSLMQEHARVLESQLAQLAVELGNTEQGDE